MSKISNIPGQESSGFIKNENLLPSIFNTTVNKKMLDSSLNLMTSKGKMLPFYNSYGTQNSSDVPGKFLATENDAIRAESQTNLAITYFNDNDEYQGKTSYLDIENYFKVKGLPLKDGTDLDDEVKVLQLPLSQYRLTDYQMYYWLPMKLAPYRIHVEDKGNGIRLNVSEQVVGNAYATVTDDTSGKLVNLYTGQRIFFTGAVDDAYKSVDPERPVIYNVFGVGTNIRLIAESVFENRVNTSVQVKIPWDEDSGQPPYMGKEWDGGPWDSNRLLNLDPEYLVIEPGDMAVPAWANSLYKQNAWCIINNWYHISRIRDVCEFYDLKVEDYANEHNRAKRPIIQLRASVKLYNWPEAWIAEIDTVLEGTPADHAGRQVDILTDKFGHLITANKLVVFTRDPAIYKMVPVQLASGAYAATWVATGVVANTNMTTGPKSGVFITGCPALKYYSFIYKYSKWVFAQNKTTPNQCPLVELYDDAGRSYASPTVYQNSRFAGAKVLDFLQGPTYDPVLKRNVQLSDIEVDALPDVSDVILSGPNQLKFYTDIDASWDYDTDVNEKTTTGVNYYKSNTVLTSFWTTRTGLDTTMPEQIAQFDKNTDGAFTENIASPVDGFYEIHVYENNGDLEFYFNLKDFGVVQFSSRRDGMTKEYVLPVVVTDAFNEYRIICHNLSKPITLYENKLVDGYTKLVALAAPVVVNNGITDGAITINLEPTYTDQDLNVVENPISADNSKFVWTFNGICRTGITRSIEKFKFITSAFLRDRTVQLYSDYDFRNASDSNTPTGQFTFEALSGLSNKANNGDKIVIESPALVKNKKTAPYALTSNPTNQALLTLDYYSIYQHLNSEQSTAPNSRELLDPLNKTFNVVNQLGTGTIHKHNMPISLFGLLATNIELDLIETINKQAKHYDTFMSRFKAELQQVINKDGDISTANWQELITLALDSIYVNQVENTFWHHSNMIGWGTDYKETTITASTTYSFATPIESISYTAGKEILTHFYVNGVVLQRGVDYFYTSNIADYYTGVKFAPGIVGQQVVIRQWPNSFSSRIPASLAKIGLSPVYMPEIYKDESYLEDTYVMIKHDGTVYLLNDGVDQFGRPVNIVDALIYEYEKMVFSSISYDVEDLKHRYFTERMPGYFRETRQSYADVTNLKNHSLISWQIENSIFALTNSTYDAANKFTYRYELPDVGVSGSWRAVYKYFFDTDRPHTHPWEMLGYSLKPTDWDTKYSWTDPAKRIALLVALSTGQRGLVKNPYYARTVTGIQPDDIFPVDGAGKLIAPLELAWMRPLITNVNFDSDYAAGELSPQECVFKSTHRGLAVDVVAKYLVRPLAFVNLLWRPGSNKNNNFNLRSTDLNQGWNQSVIDDVYHRSTDTCFTSGIEALLAEHYVLHNKDFYADVVSKSRNHYVVKEFLLEGFTNKNSIKIQSTSINSQRQALFIPEENYSVRTVNHYTDNEFYYSGMRIIWTGRGWMIYGFVNESPYFTALKPSVTSAIMNVTIGSWQAKEKQNYDTTTVTYPYGYEFSSKQDLYDFIKGYGLHLESRGFIFDSLEGSEIKNWQNAARQFGFWAEDPLLAGNYIDLNPAADEIKLAIGSGQLDSLLGTNKNPGLCVTRNNKPLFSKDLVVTRDTVTKIKTKDTSNPIYGVKFTTSVYETVVHLDPTSVFNDIYFLPNQRLSKRSFLVTGKKTADWTGRLYANGYYFLDNDMKINLDNLADQGKNLLSIENTVLDPTLINAARAQFGLDKDPELRQLFLTDESETLFKNSITFTKGTKKVFTGLEPLTHSNNSYTIPYEEYLVKIGELGNTQNIKFFEFQLRRSNVINNRQVVNFNENNIFAPGKAYTVPAKDWVHTPTGNPVEFVTTATQNALTTTGPVGNGDTNYSLKDINEIDFLYNEFKPLWAVPNFDSTASYKAGDLVRIADNSVSPALMGKVFVFTTSQGPGLIASRLEHLQQVDEQYLPNFFISNYSKPNPILGTSTSAIYPPASWQVLQTTDSNLVVKECCPGITDTSKTIVETYNAHYLQTGDKVLVINTEESWGSVNGIWDVEKIDDKTFYIPTRLTQKITHGKLFTFKPVRFKDLADLRIAMRSQQGYAWKPRLATVDSSLGVKPLSLVNTPSGYSQVYPFVVVDQVITDTEQATSWDTGGYVSYRVNVSLNGNVSLSEVKREELPVIANDIEHVIIYDYATGQTVAKVELFDPLKLVVPSLFKGELDSMSRVDPARYNRTSGQYKAVYSGTAWYEEKVGKRWWDVSTINFSDYKIGSAIERSKKWGEVNASSTVDIYEWIKSPVHPSLWQEYVNKGIEVNGVPATGEPYAEVINNVKTYNWSEAEDYVNGAVVKTFYFWVKNKSTININSNRMISALQISKTLLDPSAAGIPWCTPLTQTSMMLVGVQDLLTDTTVVQIRRKDRGAEKHQQWLFVADYNPSQTIPEYLHIRMRDSLAGAIFDEKYYPAPYNKILYLERPVPNTKLHPFNRLGNEVRPWAQTWFADLYEARRTFIKEANLILKNIDVVNSIAGWDNHLNTEVPIGEEKVDVTEMWQYVDYQASDYDSTKSVSLIVGSDADAIRESFNLSAGEYIKVVDVLLKTEVIYEVYNDADIGIVPVWRKNGTIAFNEFTKETYLKRTWDGSPWDFYPWDNIWSLLFHCIVEALRRDIFVADYQKYYNKIMCVMFRQVLSEQTHVDWLTKASTIQPYNLIGADLVQKVELERDSSETLIGYFTNVKSFRDKLRDSVITKELNEPLNVVATDSDEMNITLRYARHDMGTDIALPNISGLPFVDIGWDDRDISWDNKTWDLDTQASYDYKLEKIYSGLSGIPAESVGVILQGPTYTKYKSKENVGQELVKCYVGETNVLFDIMHHFDSTNQSIKVRTYYHNLAVRHVMLVDDKATMLHTDIDESTKVINLSPEELAKLPDATLETPGAIWINKERILYYVKTDTGITKLVRATAGTSMMNHAAGALIYPESGETVLPAFNHFGTNYTTGPYFSDAGSSLDDSNNGIVAILKNNAS